MIIGKVVGSVVSTRKSEKLVGNKFMIVEPVHHMKGDLSQIVAIDTVSYTHLNPQPLSVVCSLMVADIFYGMRLFMRIIPIKWQAILLRMSVPSAYL